MRPLILGFTGEMASGKGVATELIKQWYPAAPSFRFSDSLRKFYGLLLPALLDTGAFEQWISPTLLDKQLAFTRIRTVACHSFHLKEDATQDGVAHTAFASWVMDEFIPAHNNTWTSNASTSDLQALSTAARTHFGENVLERTILAQVKAYDGVSPVVIIEGIRRIVDVQEFFSDTSALFRLTYIESSSEIRWERHRARNEKPGDAELTFLEFCTLGEAEAESQIRSLRNVAHSVIVNMGSTEDFERSLHKDLLQYMALVNAQL